MAVSLARLPRYLILEPVSTVRLEMELSRPSCEIDVELQNPKPGRTFVLLIGKKDGPHLQRMTLSGRARVLFEPQAPGVYVLMLANPLKEPLVLRLKARNLARRPRIPTLGKTRSRAQKPSARSSRTGRRRLRRVPGRSVPRPAPARGRGPGPKE